MSQVRVLPSRPERCVMKFYTKHGCKGDNYEPGRDITDIAKLVRAELKKIAPKCKFSVRIQRYAGGQSMNVHLMTAPFEVFTSDNKYSSGRGSQLSKYQLKEDYPGRSNGDCNGYRLTKEAWEVLQETVKIVDSYRYDDSDGMIDYFSTNFYPHFEIGRWDRVFERR